MKKVVYSCLVVIGLFSCNFLNMKTEEYTSRELLIVSLHIEDSIQIEKIIFKSSYQQFTDTLTANEIEGDLLKFKCPQKGEGTYRICVYTTNDTVCCEEGYVEGGYRPELELKNNRFKSIKHF